MSDPLDDFVTTMQDEIDESVSRDWGALVYERWRNPLHLGPLVDAQAEASLRGSCGDQMTLQLAFAPARQDTSDEARVLRAGFQTDGCGPSVVCGSYAAELAIGKTPQEILDLSGQQILDILAQDGGGLPEEHRHCAHLAITTLHAAVDHYMQQHARE